LWLVLFFVVSQWMSQRLLYRKAFWQSGRGGKFLPVCHLARLLYCQYMIHGCHKFQVSEYSDSCVRIISDTLCDFHLDIFWFSVKKPILLGKFSDVFHYMKLKLAIAKIVHTSEICLAIVFMMCPMTEN